MCHHLGGELGVTSPKFLGTMVHSMCATLMGQYVPSSSVLAFCLSQQKETMMRLFFSSFSLAEDLRIMLV